MSWSEADYAALLKGAKHNLALPPKPSKYRNQRCEVAGVAFDSRREADHWITLQARERAGEINSLKRQVPFPLHCPIGGNSVGLVAEVCVYVADFVWREGKTLHVGDAKGVRTQMYRLKAKWLALEHGLTVEEL